jgi:hypothetical protein
MVQEDACSSSESCEGDLGAGRSRTHYRFQGNCTTRTRRSKKVTCRRFLFVAQVFTAESIASLTEPDAIRFGYKQEDQGVQGHLVTLETADEAK